MIAELCSGGWEQLLWFGIVTEAQRRWQGPALVRADLGPQPESPGLAWWPFILHSSEWVRMWGRWNVYLGHNSECDPGLPAPRGQGLFAILYVALSPAPVTPLTHSRYSVVQGTTWLLPLRAYLGFVCSLNTYQARTRCLSLVHLDVGDLLFLCPLCTWRVNAS